MTDQMSTANLPRIIGVTGKKRHGKDSIANLLVSEYGYTRLAFADPIKQIAMDVYDFTRDEVNGIDYDREQIHLDWGVSVRHVLQRIGTELGREIHPDTWVRVAERRIKEGPGGFGVCEDARFVISDTRFLNEAGMIHRLGGCVWRVHRPGMPDNEDTHASEVELEQIEDDAYFLNDMSLGSLQTKVRNFMEFLEVHHEEGVEK